MEAIGRLRYDVWFSEDSISGLEMDLAYMHARVQHMGEELGEYASALEASKKSERQLVAKVEEEQNNGAALSRPAYVQRGADSRYETQTAEQRRDYRLLESLY